MITDRKLIRILVQLSEEFSEAQQVISKIIRYGPTERNIKNLETEIGDILNIIDRLSGRDFHPNLEIYRLLNKHNITAMKENKLQEIMEAIVQEEANL